MTCLTSLLKRLSLFFIGSVACVALAQQVPGNVPSQVPAAPQNALRFQASGEAVMKAPAWGGLREQGSQGHRSGDPLLLCVAPQCEKFLARRGDSLGLLLARWNRTAHDPLVHMQVVERR